MRYHFRASCIVTLSAGIFTYFDHLFTPRVHLNGHWYTTRYIACTLFTNGINVWNNCSLCLICRIWHTTIRVSIKAAMILSGWIDIKLANHAIQLCRYYRQCHGTYLVGNIRLLDLQFVMKRATMGPRTLSWEEVCNGWMWSMILSGFDRSFVFKSHLNMR